MIFFEATKTLFQLLAHVLPSIFVGLYLANVLSKSGHLTHVGILMAPLSNGAKLPRGCSSVLTLCLLNKEAAFSMLSQLNRNNRLSGKEVIIVSMLASLPLCIRSIVFFVVPISFPMLGWRVGLTFTFVYFSVQLLKTIIGISAGSMMLTANGSGLKIDEAKRGPRHLNWTSFLKESIKDTLAPFLRILKTAIPTLFIAIWLIKTGALGWLSELVSPLTSMLDLPASSCLVILSGVPSMMVGISTAGPVFMSGGLTPLEVIKTLIITSLFHSLYNVFRMSFPVNITLFGPKLGGMVTCVGGLMEFTALPILFFLSGVT